MGRQPHPQSAPPQTHEERFGAPRVANGVDRTADRSEPAASVRFSRAIGWLVALAIVVLLLLAGRLLPLPLEHIVVLTFAAVAIAAAISPVAARLQRRHIPRGVTVVGVYLLVLAVLGGVVALLVPLIADEVTALQQQLPTYQQQLQHFVAQYSPSAAQRLFSGSLANSAVDNLSGFLNRLPGYLLTVSGGIVQLFVVLVLAYFMAAEEDFADRLVRRFVRPRYRPRASRLLATAGHSLGRWALGALLLALYFGIVFGVGLSVMGIPYALTLGAVGAVLEVIPYVGGLITVVLAVLAAGTKGLLWIGIVIGWYAVVAELEAHIVHPWLVGKVVHLHPMVIALALFVGGEGFGFLGLLLAVPFALMVKVALDEFYPAAAEHEREPSGRG